jgi:signal transduction histidine kinase
MIALMAVPLIAPVWLIPLSRPPALHIATLILILMLYRTKAYSFFICTGAVLIGLTTNVLLEYVFVLIADFGFDPSWFLRALRSSPSLVLGVALAITGQWYLSRAKNKDWFEGIEKITDKVLNSSIMTVSLTQLYAIYTLLVATSNEPEIFYRFPTAGRLIPFILVGSVLLAYHLSKKYFNVKECSFYPVDVVDLIFIFPVICLFIFFSGGSSSPWKLLLIPIIIANSLKKHYTFGLSSVILALIYFSYLGITAIGSGSHWFFELDLLYIAVFSFLYWSIRHFKKVEMILNKEIEHARHHILTNISHDLRTPITLIQGYIEALVKKLAKCKEEEIQFIKVIKEKYNSLLHLANGIQELEHLESGKIPFNFTKISLKEILEEVNNKYRMDVINKGVNFNISIQCDEETRLLVDSKLLDRVFANLIINALEYTPSQGLITINIQKCVDGKAILFSVKDTGHGISKKDIPFLFERFYSSNNDHSIRKGRGLGLAIFKEIIESHGGQVGVESTLGKGSIFYFTLPLKRIDCNLKVSKPLHHSHIYDTLPVAQTFSILIAVSALLLTRGFFIPLHWSVPLPILLSFALSLGLGVKEDNKIRRLLTKLYWYHLDFIILFPVIITILINTGYAQSPWKLLFIPLIITNSLKPNKTYGLLSLTLSCLSLIALGLISLNLDIAWIIEQDLAYMTFFSIDFFLVAHFIDIEKHLNKKLRKIRSSLLFTVSESLKSPLTSIGDFLQALDNKKTDDSQSLLEVLYEKAIELHRLIEDLYVMVQLESNRAILQLLPVDGKSLTRKILDRIPIRIKSNYKIQLIEIYNDGITENSTNLVALVDIDYLQKVFDHLLTHVATESNNHITMITTLLKEERNEVLFNISSKGNGKVSTLPEKTTNLIGTSIAEHLIRLHRGNFWKETDISGNTSFSLTIPLEQR